MSAKQEILNTVSMLPENTNYDEIVYMLAIYKADKRAQDDYVCGRFYEKQEAKKYVRDLMSDHNPPAVCTFAPI